MDDPPGQLPQERIQRVEPGSRLVQMHVMSGTRDLYLSRVRARRQHLVDQRGIDASGLSQDEQRWLPQLFPLGPVFSRKDWCHRSYHDVDAPSRPEAARPLLKAIGPGTSPCVIATEELHRALVAWKGNRPGRQRFAQCWHLLVIAAADITLDHHQM